MGVLACDRTGCGNIMCDRLSHEHGYLCNDCFDELCELGIQTDIHSFINSEKKERNRDAERKYFEAIFPRMDE